MNQYKSPSNPNGSHTCPHGYVNVQYCPVCAPRKSIERSMQLAIRQGFNPYDSHAAQARKYEQVVRMQVLSKMSRSEHDANVQLASSIR